MKHPTRLQSLFEQLQGQKKQPDADIIQRLVQNYATSVQVEFPDKQPQQQPAKRTHGGAAAQPPEQGETQDRPIAIKPPVAASPIFTTPEFLVHELRAPLVDLLILIRQEPENFKNQDTYRAVVGRIQELLLIVDNVLSNQKQLDASEQCWIDPDDIICNLMITISALTASKHLKLQYKSEISPGCKIKVNTQALQILARNLLTNAVANTTEGVIKVVLQPDAQGLKLSIQDSGSGMPGLYAAWLEGKHVQRSPEHGRGIGLLLARDAVKALNADMKISLHSKQQEVLSDARVAEPEASASWHTDRVPPGREKVGGTRCDVHIPSAWQASPWVRQTTPTAVDLSELGANNELRAQLQALDLYHDSKKAGLHLRWQAEPVPHLLCTDILGRTQKLRYPFSQRQLRACINQAVKPDQYKTLGQHKTPPVPKILSTRPIKGMRIVLIVDDSAISRKAMAQMFGALGWASHEADSGSTAAHMLWRMHYDLIIQDACLPNAPVVTLDIPAIATSAVSDMADKLCQTPGQWLGVLPKPIEAHELDALLQLWGKTQKPAAWDADVGAERIAADAEAALELAIESLLDLLQSWRPLVLSVKRRQNIDQAAEIAHRVLGGLHYTGLVLLTQLFDRLYADLRNKKLPSDDSMLHLRKALRQTMVLVAMAKNKIDSALSEQ